MSDADRPQGEPGDWVSANVRLKLPGGTLDLDVRLPTRPVELVDLLPMARAIEDRVVELTVIQVESTGRRITCKAGCGACCRQLVPVSEVEARQIAALIDELPEPRRSEIRERFVAAGQTLQEAGLLEPLRSEERRALDREERIQLGRTYLALGIPCPFLEDESCSIHPDRPLVCREYLVTSPAEFCARPEPGKVEGVKLPGRLWAAFAQLCDPSPQPDSIAWVPLVLAPEWAASHPDGPPPRPAPELFRALLVQFTGAGSVPDPGPFLAPDPEPEPGGAVGF